MQSESEINALIQLLDDSDREVYTHVHDKIVSFGIPVIPILENAWTTEISPEMHERIEAIIHEIQFQALLEEWRELAAMENPDLLQGFVLVSKYHFPDLSVAELTKRLAKIRQTIWLELNYNQTALEQIQIFNQVFYGYHHFRGEQASTQIQPFCIQHLLETKNGNAVSVALLYQIIANELNLPVYGVNLMRHQILAFCKHNILDFSAGPELEKQVMFYINPINKGIVFSRNEIKEYIKKSGIESKPEFFVPASNTALLINLLQNISLVHEENNNNRAVEDLAQLGAMLEK